MRSLRAAKQCVAVQNCYRGVCILKQTRWENVDGMTLHGSWFMTDSLAVSQKSILESERHCYWLPVLAIGLLVLPISGLRTRGLCHQRNRYSETLNSSLGLFFVFCKSTQ